MRFSFVGREQRALGTSWRARTSRGDFGSRGPREARTSKWPTSAPRSRAPTRAGAVPSPSESEATRKGPVPAWRNALASSGSRSASARYHSGRTGEANECQADGPTSRPEIAPGEHRCPLDRRGLAGGCTGANDSITSRRTSRDERGLRPRSCRPGSELLPGRYPFSGDRDFVSSPSSRFPFRGAPSSSPRTLPSRPDARQRDGDPWRSFRARVHPLHVVSVAAGSLRAAGFRSPSRACTPPRDRRPSRCRPLGTAALASAPPSRLPS